MAAPASEDSAAAPRSVPGLSTTARRRLRRLFALLSIVSPRLAGRLALELFVTPPRRRLDAIDAPLVARARRSRLRLAAHEIQLYEWGDARRAILLLHGWGSHAPRFGSFVDPLLAAGFRVIAADAPAHGHSTGRRSNLTLFREALARVLAERGPVHGIVAHSMGAGAAVWQVAEQPHADLRALALVSMPRGIDYMMTSFCAALGLDARVRAALRASFARRYGAPPEAYSAHALADRLHLPVLVVHDRDDDVAPFEHAVALLARLRLGELRASSGLAHSGPLRDAGTIAAIVAFMGREAA